MAKKVKKSKVTENSFASFADWWDKIAQKKVDKIEKDWLSETEPNDPDEESGGDSWHVNDLMHSGEAHNATYDIAEEVFNKGKMVKLGSLVCQIVFFVIQMMLFLNHMRLVKIVPRNQRRKSNNFYIGVKPNKLGSLEKVVNSK